MDNMSRREREKLMREQEILDAATTVFYTKGYEGASMDEIAREAQFTKSTLYQYFENKEDLYFYVALKVFKKLFFAVNEVLQGGQPGFVKLQESGKVFYRFFKENPEAIRIISLKGAVRKKAAGDNNRSDEMLQLNNELFLSIATVISEGIADGSIRKGLDVEKTAFSLTFLLTGFFNLLSSTGENFTSHFSLDIDDFSLFTMDLLLTSLKNIKAVD